MMWRRVDKLVAGAELSRRSRNITDLDLPRVIHKQEEIRRIFELGGPLRRYLSDLKLLLGIVRDYWTGEYRQLPWFTIAAVVAALLYVLNPLDMIPDILPGIGYLDDATVVAFCLNLVEADLLRYREWKLRQG